MLLDLRELITRPGESVEFEFELERDDLEFEGVIGYRSPICVRGEVTNHAGLLELNAVLDVELMCQCARCLKEFPKRLTMDIAAYLTEELEDEDNVEYYLLRDGAADLSEIARDAFVLNMDERILCSDGCKGLCPKCGKDLNDGPCDCQRDRDPRLAVLGQLLEDQ